MTNGISWWFYLPLREGSWEQRKFYTIEIYDQETEEIINKFKEFLSKENVISNKAIQNAENIYKSKQKKYLIKETLPKAWNRIITEPDELLVEILADTTEKLCGYKPDNETVEKFLRNIYQLLINNDRKINTKYSKNLRVINKNIGGYVNKTNLILNKNFSSEDYTKKSIISFTFRESIYEVRSWKELLIKIIDYMVLNHKEQFERVLLLTRKKKTVFYEES